MEITAKTYGKILVFGAYSILEPGNIGLVVNIDKGTKVTVKDTERGRIVFDLTNFKIIIEGIIQNNRLIVKRDPKIFTFIKNAVDYSYRYLNYKNQKLKDIKLISYTDPELYFHNKIKTGFGSSAASTVSTVAAVLALHGIEDREIIFKIARYAHYKSQGNLGSGFDIASGCFGSHYFLSGKMTLDEDFIKFINQDLSEKRKVFDWPASLIPMIAFTGQSASTQDMIKKIMEYKKKNLNEYSTFIRDYNNVNLQAKEAFENNNIFDIKQTLHESWRMRKKLGEMAKANIETEKMTKLLDEIKHNGAYIAGLIGAGGGDSILALCKSKEDRQQLNAFLEKRKLVLMENVQIFNSGYDFAR